MPASCILLVVLLQSVAFASTLAVDVPVRAISIDEAPGSVYLWCNTVDRTAFNMATATGVQDCSRKSTYGLYGYSIVTADERRQLCSCTLLISQLQTTVVPYCWVHKDTPTGRWEYNFASTIRDAFRDCSVQSTSSITTITTAPSTTVASRTTTSSPSKESTTGAGSDSGGTNYYLIGGSSGGGLLTVGVIALAVYNWRKKKKAGAGASNDVGLGLNLMGADA